MNSHTEQRASGNVARPCGEHMVSDRKDMQGGRIDAAKLDAATKAAENRASLAEGQVIA